MKELAQYIKILGDANRLSIIKSIGDGSRSVTEIINLTDMSQTLVSFHLRALRDAGLVSTRKEGPFIFYSINNVSLLDTLDELSLMAGMGNSFFSSRQMTGQGGL